MNHRPFRPSSHTRTSSNRLLYGDGLRVIASFGVVMVHVAANVFARYGAIPTTDWLIVNVWKSVGLASVLLFLLLSGAIALQTSKPLDLHFVWKRWQKFVPLLVIWNIVYLLWMHLAHGQPLWNPPAFETAFTIGDYYHLYYLYILLLVTTLAPFFHWLILRHWEWAQHFLGFLLILCAGVWFQCLQIKVMTPYMIHARNILPFAAMFLLGGMIEQHHAKEPHGKRGRHWMGLSLLTTSLTALSVWAVSARAQTQGLDQNNTSFVTLLTSPLLIGLAVCLFYLVRMIPWERGGVKLRALLRQWGNLTLGVYLVHPIWLESVQIGLQRLAPHWPVFNAPSTLFIALIVFGLSLASTWGVERLLLAFRPFLSTIRTTNVR
jgi:surface polysaccharide O-acyltransferase-like enzyme